MVPTDRDALGALFLPTRGANWRKNTNWDTDADLSQWHGVEVNDQGGVVKLILSSNNLGGISLTTYSTDTCCSLANVFGVSQLVDRTGPFYKIASFTARHHVGIFVHMFQRFAPGLSLSAAYT